MPVNLPSPMPDDAKRAALDVLDALHEPGAVDPDLAALICQQLHDFLGSTE
jgi:hypothetical protein